MLLKYKHNDDALNNVINPARLLIIYMQTLFSFIASFSSAAMLVFGGH